MIAPSLIPRSAADRVKTDRRDCRKLARLHRFGNLTAIRVLNRHEEAVRDLCRARADMVEDLDRARKRLGAFLLRHSVVWRGGSAWTVKHHEWLAARRFDDAAMAATFAHYRSVVEGRQRELAAATADLAGWYDRDPFAEPVRRLCAYRGVAQLGALTPGVGGVRLAALRAGVGVHGIHRPGPLRVLQRRENLPGPYHQGG